MRALWRLLLPFLFVDRPLLACLMLLLPALKKSGESIFVPSELVKNVLSPKSKPAFLPVMTLLELTSSTSHEKKRYISPSASRFMVSVLTSPAISRDLKNLYCLFPIFISLPSSSLNPACLRVIDLYFTLFLNDGGLILPFFECLKKS